MFYRDFTQSQETLVGPFDRIIMAALRVERGSLQKSCSPSNHLNTYGMGTGASFRQSMEETVEVDQP